MDQPNSLIDYFSTLQFDVISGHYTECTERWANTDLFPDYYRIYYITEGIGWIKVGNQEIYPRQGELWWLPAFVHQQYALPDKNNAMKHYWVHFHATFGGQTPILDIVKVPMCVKPGNGKEIIATFKDLFQAIQSRAGIVDEVSSKIHLLKLIKIYLDHCQKEVLICKPSLIGKVMPAIKYVDQNLSRTLTVELLAQTVHLQPNYFSVLFRKIIGLSPIQYVIQKRMDKAKMLLTYTDKPLYNIAEELGFADQFRFSKLFKKHVSVTPLAYRNTNKTTKEP
jgi:AraC family transcriptional regulator, arabinose operon regulatory protein